MNAPTAAIVTRLSLKYVKASIIYLVAGSTLALLTFSDVMPFAITAFYFIQLYGFVAMMIFGLSTFSSRRFLTRLFTASDSLVYSSG